MDNHSLRWLHITDLHVGLKNESQRTALSSLISAITKHSNSKAFDFVFFTGDLAFSGLQDEYLELERLLINPLRESPLTANAKYLACPGNHDLNCDIGLPPVWSSLGKSRQEKFFHLDKSGTQIRKARAEGYMEYASFMRRNGLVGVDPTQEPASLAQFSLGDRKISVVSAVTSFFSDREVPDFQKSPAPVHPVRTLLQTLDINTQIIVLGHHPPEWFIPETERHFHSLLVEKNALYIHGHDHRIRAKFGAHGLTSIGFGAGYLAPHDSLPTPYYRNSFAICEIDESVHVCIVSWDAENGQWRPDQSLPGDFVDRSHILTDGYCLPLPTTKLRDKINNPNSAIASAIRGEVRIEKCFWLADSDPKRWTELLTTIGQLWGVTETYTLRSQTLPAGHSQFRVRDQRGLYLIHAVSGHGDVLNYEQLQAINTELDRQDYDGCIVVTLGEVSGEAQTLATQLASRKSILVLERADLVRQIVRNLSPSLARAFFAVDTSTALGSIVVTRTGFALLLQERTTKVWFQVLGEDGGPMSESSGLVMRLREELPLLRSLRYDISRNRDGIAEKSTPQGPDFDRTEYLRRSHAYFDDVKYAPLAALGMRFRKASLSEIYVDATADVGGSSKTSDNLTRAVSDFVESLNLPPAQRDQLESQLRTRHNLSRTAEVGAARSLYQRYNNVMVLGDPGSGKTCFVQHEILAYCRPPENQAAWYSSHLPIYVSLAEASRLLDDKTGVLDICEIVASRRGISLPRSIIEDALFDGKAALFFDGLDEVGYIDRRISLMSQIDDLVVKYAPIGNRFVLASRPAAIQPVEVPEALTYLRLKGLTEDEIRILSARVLTARIGIQEEVGLTGEEAELINRLLEDTRNVPGIARIARNPLLLTLLVLTYASTGAISARRHLIYSQAIKTLVSVRGRETKEQQISEADLRTRLGSLALGIFQRDIPEIPGRSEVSRLLSPLMPPGTIQRTNNESANSFIQEVAEATGLLTIHSRDESDSDDLITFMHYSFLEYYAATGLLAGNYQDLVPSLSGNPRWKDVVTLLFGILSEQRDVTPILEQMLCERTPSEEISKYRTILGLECASECDVPPEATQDILGSAIFDTVTKGVGRYSADLRIEIAKRLEYFLQGSGPRLEYALIQGLKDPSPLAAAAFADLIARIGESVKFSQGVIDAFYECIKHTNTVTRASAMFAIECRPDLRGPQSREFIKSSLHGSVVEKHAALKVVASVPVFHDAVAEDVRGLLDDPNTLISATAAQCMLLNSLKGTRWLESAALQEKVLTKLNQSTQDTGLSSIGVTLDQDSIELALTAGSDIEKELAIRYIPMIQQDDQFVYRVLMQALRTSENSPMRAACLDSLRSSPGAIDLITIADTDAICAALEAPERNIRIAAVRLLGQMPDDEQVVSSLQRHLNRSAEVPARGEEVTETAKSLANHVRRNQKLRTSVLENIFRLVPTKEAGFGDSAQQNFIFGLLLVCESIGGVADGPTAQRLRDLAENFKTPSGIKRQSMRVFGRIAEPSIQNIDVIISALRKNDSKMNDSVYVASAYFVSQCSKKVEYMRVVNPKLDELRHQLCEAWRRESLRGLESIAPPGLRAIRDSIVELGSLVIAYEEFSERAKVA